MRKKKQGIHCSVTVFVIILTVAFLGAAVKLFLFSTTPEVSLIMFFVLIGVALPLMFIFEFSEVTLFGFKIKVLEKVKEIEKNLFLSQVVHTVDSNGEFNWFWIDQFGDAYNIDKETAEFLSKDGNIKKVDSVERFNLKGKYPSWKDTAQAMFNGPTVFIKYNEVLYYQQGLAWLYKLAALNSIDFTTGQFSEWKDTEGGDWAKQLAKEDLLNFKVA